jgi:hypothetical protein
VLVDSATDHFSEEILSSLYEGVIKDHFRNSQQNWIKNGLV